MVAPDVPSNTKPVAEAHKFDEKALSKWMASNVKGFKLSQETGPLQVFQFTHGQSNPTFLLVSGSGKNTKKYVLRKKPPGKLLPSAHAIEREYHVMSALAGSRVPVPRTYGLCEQDNVIGTPFYIMQYIEGRIFKDIELPKMHPTQRFAIYAAMNKVLAELHSVDLEATGLKSYGKPEGFIARNAKRWADQYEKSKTELIPDFEDLKDSLIKNTPNDEASNQVSLIHGDFRLDNIIFHPTEPRVLAVLDWELSTLGAPISDFAYNCLPYYSPSRGGVAELAGQGLNGLDLVQLGIPELRTYKNMYIQNSRRAVGTLNNWEFYVSLSYFRLAAISQGVYKRALQGNASSSHANKYGDVSKLLAKLGLSVYRSQLSTKTSAALIDIQSAKATLGMFKLSDKFWDLRSKLLDFMDQYIYPNEAVFEEQHLKASLEQGTRWVDNIPIREFIKTKAKEAGLWNLFLTQNKTHQHSYGAGLTNLEYAPLCEIMGRSPILAPEAFNCAAPDTGNMEVLTIYGTQQQQKTWLTPLLQGEIRSCFGMTEPLVASSDATNIEANIERVEDGYIINARKWWTSGAGDPRCKVCIFMGKTDPTAPKHQQQSMLIVPMDAPGVRVVRAMHVFGNDDAPHGHPEVEFKNVKVPLENMLLGEGRGFEIAQGRLGPGRIHHCMRLIGMAERALDMMLVRVHERYAHGALLLKKGAILKDIADMRIEIEKTRLLTLQAAAMMDTVGNKHAKQQIAMIKVAAPKMALSVIDKAIQSFGGMGISQDTILATLWTHARTLRLADGPDEVHRESIANLELTRTCRL
ncbi:acyl-CoA dehydrogenase [Acrasis kona]|uniref:Acyl-CoA dehydrogenase n=1 Tax=Acrasis kona TaxID=1008807 RepID=A0AAW2ZH43_9EUKA